VSEQDYENVVNRGVHSVEVEFRQRDGTEFVLEAGWEISEHHVII
jgi:hypothetical protein